MALVVADRLRETSTTAGTGTYTLAGAVIGHQSFSVVGDGNTTYYTATDGTDWEVGTGTYTASGTTLARTTIHASSNSGSAVDWSTGTRNIYGDLPAAVLDSLLSGGGGDFTGPGSSTDNALVRFDGTGGKTGQNSGVIIDDNAGYTATILAAATVGVSLTAHASQSANMQEWKDSGGTVGARITSSQEFSNPGIGSSESFGAGATTGSRSGCTAVGLNADASAGNDATSFGGNSTAGTFGSAFGEEANNSGSGLAMGRLSDGHFAVGYAADSTGHSTAMAMGTAAVGGAVYAIAIGSSADSSYSSSIVIGRSSVSTAAYQFIVGSSTAPITTAYIGEGVTSTSPQDITYHATGGSGTNIAAGDFIIAGGKATGNATGGSVVFQTPDAGSSGTSLQSLTEKVRIDVEGGMMFTEQSAAPSSPANGTECRTYMKGDKFIIQYYDGTNTKYRYLDLTSTDATWTYTTSAP